MLAKAVGGSMWYAYNNMNAWGVRLNSRLYKSALVNIGPQQSERAKQWYAENPHPRGMLGKKHSKKSIEKMTQTRSSKSEKEKKKSSEKLRETRYKNNSNIFSEEHKGNISKAKVGKKHGEKTRQKISETRKQKIKNGEIIFEISQETRDKISKSNKGKINPHKNKTFLEIVNNDGKVLEWKTKISESNRGKKRTQETREKMSRTRVGLKDSDKTKRNKSKSRKRLIDSGWEYSEESKEKMSKSKKGVPKPEGFGGLISKAKRGMIYINNGNKNKMVHPDELEDYLTSGWKLGMIKRKRKDE
jgi:hypothetical protein